MYSGDEMHGFARRLRQSMDNHPACPVDARSRCQWLSTALSRKFNLDISDDEVALWIAGEKQPGQDTVTCIAEHLSVELAWLRMGHRT